MKAKLWAGFKNFAFWASDKIVTGFVAAVKFLPVADRFLAHWAGRLLTLMLAHKIVSLIILAALPLFSFFVLEEDGLFEPLSDALDIFLDIFELLPLELILIGLPLGLAAAILAFKYKRNLSFGQAAKEAFFAFGSRLIYLFIIMMILMLLLQLSPLKGSSKHSPALGGPGVEEAAP